MNTAVLGRRSPGSQQVQAAGIGLWVFIGVAGTLFTLFLAAYVMRMESADWWPIPMPWQTWLSTAVLIAGSFALHRSTVEARAARHDAARVWLRAGGIFAFVFLAVQLWAWQSLRAAGVVVTGNPSASFFYMLTALHGLHVIGGLMAWASTSRAAKRLDAAAVAWRIALCARYWHFLLAVWVVLFAALGWVTPEVVRFICGPDWGNK